MSGASSFTVQPGRRFVIASSDGDQSYLGEPIKCRLVERAWFPSEIPDWGQALLLLVTSGRHAGEYVAVTARTVGKLKDQIEERGWASIVLHVFNGDPATFSIENPPQSSAPGMSVIESVNLLPWWKRLWR